MQKTKELNQKLQDVFSRRENWNKHIVIDGTTFIYISAANEIRYICKHSSGFETANLIACFVSAHVIWCC